MRTFLSVKSLSILVDIFSVLYLSLLFPSLLCLLSAGLSTSSSIHSSFLFRKGLGFQYISAIQTYHIAVSLCTASPIKAGGDKPVGEKDPKIMKQSQRQPLLQLLGVPQGGQATYCNICTEGYFY